MTQYVYRFDEGNSEMRNLLGGKGAGLAEMTRMGIPVPPGFTITTELCMVYYALEREYPAELDQQVSDNIAIVEGKLQRKFGDPDHPLLVSVRSGARKSMPGMMDTVLNLGINDAVAKGLARESGNERFAYDTYRRFVQMYADVVLGLKPENDKEPDPFEVILEAKKHALGVKDDTELPASALKELVTEFKAEILKRRGVVFPDDPWEQLWGAIGAVFGSWNNPRAITYRRMYDIPDDWGTAVNVQAMVYGNLGDDCATGVGFTRDPSTGVRKFYGEYLVNAQGEDVVAGIRTPQPVTKEEAKPGQISLEEYMPEAFAELDALRNRLEKHYRDMQDIEFTIQQRKVWLLQTRDGKRTGQAAVHIAVDLVNEGVIDKETSVLRVEPESLNQLLHPIITPEAKKRAGVLVTGLNASPGAASGKVVFSPQEAVLMAAAGEDVILVRDETSPEDISGMESARGILTKRGGMTSHAAVVARGMGRCCVAGAGDLSIDYDTQSFSVNDTTVRKGDYITLDGSTGEVFLGKLETQAAEPDEYLSTLMSWADDLRELKVRTNADTPKDAQIARDFDAEGIGLCRTEHMFFDGDKILPVREMILANDEEGRRRALTKILPLQRSDFEGIFRVMEGLPVTIRLLDAPLHEFLPKEHEIAEVAKALEVDIDALRQRNEALKETNPMLGHRGCRLAVTFPEIYETQVQAIIEAAINVSREGKIVLPEIMIPIVGIEDELAAMRALVDKTAEKVFATAGTRVDYTIGTMIEVPRACVTADKLAQHADFFSFGTNDLTQTTFALSRDDSSHFLPAYVDKGVIEVDPFVRLDRVGVGGLMQMAEQKGRSIKPNLKLGICGEHGGDPSSVEFCHELGLDYVSCSPYRVLIARLAAAQAVVKQSQKEAVATL